MMSGVSCVRDFVWIICAGAENVDSNIVFGNELFQPQSTLCGGGYCVEDECADGLSLIQLQRLIDELLNAGEFAAVTGEETLRNSRLLDSFAAVRKREEGNVSLLLGYNFGNPSQRETFNGYIDLSYFCHI